MSQHSKEWLTQTLRQMLVIRTFEETADKLTLRGKVPGGMHNSSGQEAVAVGSMSALAADDVIATTHRSHHHTLAKGFTAKEVMAELFTKATGCSRGRGGSMHLFAPEIGMLGTSGIVGPCILQAAGAGYSFKLMKTGNVGVAFFGFARHAPPIALMNRFCISSRSAFGIS